LRQDAQRFEAAVNEGVRVGLSQAQFDALVSFAYNVGANAFLGSTLLRRLNAGEYRAVPAEMKRWTNGGLPGLVRRRNAEGDLFSLGQYGHA
jgi:lysozyme